MAKHGGPTRPALLLSAKAASAASGIPYNSLRDIAHRGELAVVRIGRAWYFKESDLAHWIESRAERLS